MPDHKSKNSLSNSGSLPQATSSESLAIIDWEKSKQIMNNNLFEAKQILKQLLNYLPDALRKIHKAVQLNNNNMLLDEVHKVHGACSYCGVPRLKTAAKSLELALRKADLQQVNELLPLLEQEVNLLLKAAEQDIILNEK